MDPKSFLRIVASGLSRRAFLKGSAATTLIACGGSDESTVSPPVEDASDGPDVLPEVGADSGPEPDAGTELDVPFGVWKEIRAALRTSPDHLVAQAERLVSEGNPEAIFAFVRDRFLTLPDGPNSLGGLTKRLWGIRGTMRSGTGTLRDKAELLVELYHRAGFTAEVMEVRTPNDPAFVDRVLMRAVDRPFAPEVEASTLSGWRESLGLTEPPEPSEVIDDDHASAAALAGALLGVIPDAQTTVPFNKSKPGYMPVVAVEVGGQVRFANVADPEAVFGEAGGEGDPRSTDPAADFPQVTLRLSMVTTASPKTPIEIATATYSVDELVGRQVSIAMVPPEDARTLVQMRFGDVRTFLPVLSLQGPDMTKEEREARVVASKAITLAGEVLELEGDDITYQGVPIDTGPADAALIASVASLEVEVMGSAYPEIRVRASALDAQGNSVQGLTAAAFELREESEKQRFMLMETRASAPRVLFILDQSTSLPATFLGAQAAVLLRTIAEDVLAGAPDATFRVHMVGGNPMDGAWTGDPAEVEQSALDQTGFGSSLWGALADGWDMRPTTVVMVTDGQATDVPSAEELARIAELPPCVFLAVGEPELETLEDMASRTAGKVFAVEAQDEAAAAALAMVIARRNSTYLLRYAAPESGPPLREVELTLVGSSVSSQGDYEVPPVDERLTPPRIGGLILDVEVTGADAVRQVIAGVAEVPEDAPAALFDDVHAALFGSAEVRFEGASPTFSAMVDDLLVGRLSWEPMWLAMKGGDPDTIVDTFVQGFQRYNARALALVTTPAPVDGTFVFPTGLRAVLTTMQPRYGVGVVRRASILPMGGYRAVDEDRRGGLEASVHATARLGLLEGGLFQRSTASELEGASLIGLNPFALISSAIPGLSAEQRAAWERAMDGFTGGYRIVPATGEPVAFWYVDRATGSLLGVLEDGSGGGSSAEELEALERQLTALINWVNAVGGYFGILGMQAGVWLSLEKAKLKKLIAATIAIGTLTSPVGIEDFSGVAGDVACDAIKGAAGEVFDMVAGSAGLSIIRAAAAIGTGILKADSFVEASLGEAPIDC